MFRVWPVIVLALFAARTVDAAVVTADSTPDKIFLSAIEDVQTQLKRLNELQTKIDQDENAPANKYVHDQQLIDQQIFELKQRLRDEFEALWAQLSDARKGYTERAELTHNRWAYLRPVQNFFKRHRERIADATSYLTIPLGVAAGFALYLVQPNQDSPPVMILAGAGGAITGSVYRSHLKYLISTILDSLSSIWLGTWKLRKKAAGERRRAQVNRIPDNLLFERFVEIQPPKILRRVPDEEDNRTYILELTPPDGAPCTDWLAEPSAEENHTDHSWVVQSLRQRHEWDNSSNE